MDVNNETGKNQDEKLKQVLENSIQMEEELTRTYLIAAERVHDDDNLKDRLENFAQGNAKRTKQLVDELNERNK